MGKTFVEVWVEFPDMLFIYLKVSSKKVHQVTLLYTSIIDLDVCALTVYVEIFYSLTVAM